MSKFGDLKPTTNLRSLNIGFYKGVGDVSDAILLLLLHNRKSLNRLRLGTLDAVLKDHWMVSQEQFHNTKATDILGDLAKLTSRKGNSKIVPMRLEIFELCGLNFNLFLEPSNPIWFDFTNLHILVLHSCVGLRKAFNRLKQNGGSNTAGQPVFELKLRKLAIRIDDGGEGDVKALIAFLCAFHGLTHLSVLLHGYEQQYIDPVLKVHGKTLRSLVWDERLSRRYRADQMVHNFLNYTDHLHIIATFCPDLTALGMAVDWRVIDWENIMDTDKSVQRIMISSSSGYIMLTIARLSWVKIW